MFSRVGKALNNVARWVAEQIIDNPYEIKDYFIAPEHRNRKYTNEELTTKQYADIEEAPPTGINPDWFEGMSGSNDIGDFRKIVRSMDKKMPRYELDYGYNDEYFRGPVYCYDDLEEYLKDVTKEWVENSEYADFVYECADLYMHMNPYSISGGEYEFWGALNELVLKYVLIFSKYIDF